MVERYEKIFESSKLRGKKINQDVTEYIIDGEKYYLVRKSKATHSNETGYKYIIYKDKYDKGLEYLIDVYDRKRDAVDALQGLQDKEAWAGIDVLGDSGIHWYQ